VALTAFVAILAVGTTMGWLALAGLAIGILLAATLAYHLIHSERERHETVEAERARLSDQLITAEQDERRRLALFLHDVPVQAMSGIALMLDGVLDAIRRGANEDAERVLQSALDLQRETIRELRDLSFALEPVVLRDQGFGAAVKALAEQVGLSHRIQIDLDVEAGEALAERAQASLYQIIREAIDQAVRRGPPTRMEVRLASLNGGGVEAVIVDDSPGERRRRSFDEIEERARTLQGRVAVETSPDGAGTVVRVTLPPYTAQR
jgi:signal transduction histidine kinase